MKKQTYSWVSDDLEIINIKYGKGLFAKKNIKKDEFLSILGGYAISALDESVLPKKVSDYGIQISENMILGYKKESEVDYSCFFNHSCDPNTGIKGQIFLVAMRDIKKGEQITFDYAMTLHKVKGLKAYKMECLCGSKNCRGLITEDDWKIPELQKKYKGYFQWYLEEKIKTLKKHA
jgi:SET domain-containing protein